MTTQNTFDLTQHTKVFTMFRIYKRENMHTKVYFPLQSTIPEAESYPCKFKRQQYWPIKATPQMLTE